VTQATNNAAVNVISNGDIFVDAGGTHGIFAGTAGSGNVTVTALSAKVIDPADYGIEAKGAGGNAQIDTTNEVIADITGLKATTSGAGTVKVYVKANTGTGITGTSTDGIEATTTGTGQVSVGDAGNRIVGDILGGTNGIVASGLGNVEVWTGAVTVDGTAGVGIDATSTSGQHGRRQHPRHHGHRRHRRHQRQEHRHGRLRHRHGDPRGRHDRQRQQR
jgi:hypothetical protein